METSTRTPTSSTITAPSASSSSTSTIRQTHKRTFSESDSSSRTERHLCSFSHLWIINYLSSYLDDPNSTCLQSESFSPVNTPYSNTRWSLKLYPRGLNEKQHTNNNLAIFLKYISGTMPTIKAKAEFSVVSRNNELVMLRSTNFHTFSSGNDWGYSEFLDGNYLNSRRNDLLTDDRLRVYVRVILVDEKESLTSDVPQHSSVILPSSHVNSGQPASTGTRTQASTSASSSSTSSSVTNTHPSSSITLRSGLFSNEKDRYKSFELLSNQLKSLLDDERFTDVHIHVIPKQCSSTSTADEQRKSPRIKRNSFRQISPSCSSCHCSPEKSTVDSHDQTTSSGIDEQCSNSSICPTRRATRSTTSLLSRLAQTSSDSPVPSSSIKRCSCSSPESLGEDFHQSQAKYSHITPLATFHVHQALLIARSSSFAHQFRFTHLHGSSHNLKLPPIDFYIDDLDPSTVRAMLIYIYTGRLPLITDEQTERLNPIDLFRAAVKYNLNELRDLAKSTMLEMLKIDNAIEMLEVSDQANDASLKHQVFSFIRSNASAVSKTNHWFNASKRHPHLIIDAFRSLVSPSTTKLNSNHLTPYSTSSTTTTTSKYPKSD